jgi:hypothetical protein
MAIVTGIAACYMSRVFSGCGDAVVTRAASTDDLSVVDSANRCPDIGGVAVFADIARLNVREILACGICTVVAVNAVVRNVRVIEIRR